MKMLVLLICTLASSVAFAAGHHKEPSNFVDMVFFLVAFAPSLYAANKWRLWKWGFEIGMADKKDFISALKWTIGAIVWLAVVGVAATIIYG